MSIDYSKLSVTSRDYQSIYDELIEAIPVLTKRWNSTDEADPGIALVKLMAMLGDMLSYNHDKAVLELYPSSVMQRKNALQVFKLAGYKMRWYRSAVCDLAIQNIGENPAILPRYTVFTNGDKSVSYVYTGKDMELESNNSLKGRIYTVELTEGVPVTPSRSKPLASGFGTENWHDIYDYNVLHSDIVNSRIYLNDNNVDELSIRLIDNDGDEWTQVDNIEALMMNGKYFELTVDEDDRAYIKLCSDWDTITNTKLKFKLFYIISSGADGGILDNVIDTVSGIWDQLAYTNSDYTNFVDVSSNMMLQNYRSTLGYDPETADEAREEFAKYVGTYDTLITTGDFTKATKRLNGVSNCICTDVFTDYNTELANNQINVYITRTSDYENYTDDAYKAYILTSLEELKMMPISMSVYLDDEVIDNTVLAYYLDGNEYQRIVELEEVKEEPTSATESFLSIVIDEDNVSRFSIVSWDEDITVYRLKSGTIQDGDSRFQNMEVICTIPNRATDYYYWSPTGKIYLKEPVTIDVAQDLLVKINNYLTTTFNVASMEYNTPLRYIDVINEITGIDSSIQYVDMDSLSYSVPVTVYGKEGSTENKIISTEDVSGRYTLPVSSVSWTQISPLLGETTPSDVELIDGGDRIAFRTNDETTETIEVYNYKSSTVKTDYDDSDLVYKAENTGETKKVTIHLKNDRNLFNSIYYHRPLKKGSLMIRMGNLDSIIFDNRSGVLTSSNVYFTNGTVDYDTGEVTIEFSTVDTGALTVSYGLNKNGIIRYSAFNANSFTIADDSLKDG